jgi:putative transposase
MQRIPIENDEIYHVYNRGVEKRDVFMDDGDHWRFIHYLYQCNDVGTCPNLSYYTSLHSKEVEPAKLVPNREKRTPIVDILAYALMPNHYHLMLQQRVDGGVSKFMHDVATGFTMFFNEKYDRSGSLFQGRYKYKPVTTQSQLLYLPHYIHLNPIKLIGNQVNLGGSTSLDALLGYRWSSLRDYAGMRNIPSILEPKLILETFGGSQQYVNDLRRLLDSDRQQLAAREAIRDIAHDLDDV